MDKLGMKRRYYEANPKKDHKAFSSVGHAQSCTTATLLWYTEIPHLDTTWPRYSTLNSQKKHFSALSFSFCQAKTLETFRRLVRSLKVFPMTSTLSRYNAQQSCVSPAKPLVSEKWPGHCTIQRLDLEFI